MIAPDLPIVIVREMPSEPRDVRTDLLDGYEVVQRLGYIKRKVVNVDLATADEIQALLAVEFPGGRGGYVFESVNYSNPLGTCHERMSCVLTGSKKTPAP